MKIFCISNNKDLAIGIKLTGIPSVFLEDDKLIIEKVDSLLENEDLEMIIVNDSLFKKDNLPFKKIMEEKKIPLIVSIPETKK